MKRLLLVAFQDEGVSELRASASGAWEGFLRALPRVGIAIAVLVALVVVGRLARPAVRVRLQRRRSRSFAKVFAKLTSSAATLIGLLLAVTIVFPSVGHGDGCGQGSIRRRRHRDAVSGDRTPGHIQLRGVVARPSGHPRGLRATSLSRSGRDEDGVNDVAPGGQGHDG